MTCVTRHLEIAQFARLVKLDLVANSNPEFSSVSPKRCTYQLRHLHMIMTIRPAPDAQLCFGTYTPSCDRTFNPNLLTPIAHPVGGTPATPRSGPSTGPTLDAKPPCASASGLPTGGASRPTPSGASRTTQTRSCPSWTALRPTGRRCAPPTLSRGVSGRSGAGPGP